MVFRGVYDNINGIHRPYIAILVRSRDGVWVPLPFLIDSGADAAFLDASCLQQMGGRSRSSWLSKPPAVSEGRLPMCNLPLPYDSSRDEGSKTFTGVVGVFTDPATWDTPVPGRDAP